MLQARREGAREAAQREEQSQSGQRRLSQLWVKKPKLEKKAMAAASNEGREAPQDSHTECPLCGALVERSCLAGLALIENAFDFSFDFNIHSKTNQTFAQSSMFRLGAPNVPLAAPVVKQNILSHENTETKRGISGRILV